MIVDGAEFWITCKRLKLLRKAGRLQLIQNSAPSTIVWRQCDIRITLAHSYNNKLSQLQYSDASLFDNIISMKISKGVSVYKLMYFF